MSDEITLYKSDFCAHSWRVEQLLKKHQIVVNTINIDGNSQARQEVMDLNNGYASVPTLLFPDGTQLTEPSQGELKEKLGLRSPGLLDRLRGRGEE